MSQSTTAVVLQQSKKQSQRPEKLYSGAEVVSLKAKELPAGSLISKKNSLGEIGGKRAQKESLIQELIDCLESKKQEVEKLEEIIRYKDKTIKLLNKRHLELQKSAEQIGRLQATLHEKTATIQKLNEMFKTVSERMETLLKKNFQDTANVDELLQRALIRGSQQSGTLSNRIRTEEVNCNKLFAVLDILQDKIKKPQKITSIEWIKSEPTLLLGPGPISALQVEPPLRKESSEKTDQEHEKFANIKLQRDQLKQLLTKTEKAKNDLANAVESGYLRIKAELKNKSSYPPECLDDLIILMQKAERQDKRIQQYAVELVKVRNDFSEQMRETLHRIRSTQRSHEEVIFKKDSEIISLKSKLHKS